MHILVAELSSELLAQNFFHAREHKIDDLLRGVDDAERVRAIDGETLEELLVNGVQKFLLFGKLRNGVGGVLNRFVKAIELFQERVTRKGAAR